MPTDTQPIPVTDPPERRRPRRWWVPLLVLGLLVALLVPAALIGDTVVRREAERIIVEQVRANLPETVTGDLTAEVRGGSAILQYLRGSFDDVTIDAPELLVDGAPVSASVRVAGLPADGTGPVGSISASLDAGQEAVDALVPLDDGVTLALGDGDVVYRGSASLLGLRVGYSVTAVPTLEGGEILFTPTAAEVSGLGFDLPVDRLLPLVAPDGFRVCAAELLPAGIVIDSVDLAGGGVRIALSATGLELTEETLRTTGACA